MVNINNIKTRDSDIFVVSYPRSGNYWVRFMLGTYFNDVKIDWNNFKKYCPMIYHVSGIDLKQIKPPRIIGSHNKYVADLPNVIYIIRDPRDVVISQYFYNLKRGHVDCEFDDFFDEFINKNINSFGDWEENVRSWFNHADYFTFYERLLDNTEEELSNIIYKLTDEVNDNKIDEAVEWCRFDNMKRLEKEQGHLNQQTVKDIDFIRKGKSKQWEDFLSDNQKETINNEFFDILDLLNYE